MSKMNYWLAFVDDRVMFRASPRTYRSARIDPFGFSSKSICAQQQQAGWSTARQTDKETYDGLVRMKQKRLDAYGLRGGRASPSDSWIYLDALVGRGLDSLRLKDEFCPPE